MEANCITYLMVKEIGDTLSYILIIIIIIIIITGFLFALSAYSFKHFEIDKRSKTVQKMQTTGYNVYSSRTVWSDRS